MMPSLARGLLAALAVPAVLAVLASCRNEVDLLEDTPPVPVVYGLFDAGVDTQTVSITKTFRFAPGAGAREAAVTADSVYYGPEELSAFAENARTGTRVSLEPYSASAAGVARAPGVFAPNPNQLYRYAAGPLDLEPGDDLSLLLERPDGALARGNARVLPPLGYIPNREPPTRYAFTSDRDFTFGWRVEGDPTLVQLYEVGFNFAFSETRDGVSTPRVVYWPAATELPGETTVRFSINGLYGFLAGRLEEDPAVTRRFEYVQLVITGGDQSFSELQALVRANNGVTSTQELPPFSNVEGGIGLFGGVTRLVQEPDGSLTNDAFDELYGGDATRGLNFEP